MRRIRRPSHGVSVAGALIASLEADPRHGSRPGSIAFVRPEFGMIGRHGSRRLLHRITIDLSN